MIFRYCLLLLTLYYPIYGASNYLADISFFVADLKYSEEYGVKICEVQQGLYSTFYGDMESNGGNRRIALNFASSLSQIPIKKWISFKKLFPSFLEALYSSGWAEVPFFDSITSDAQLLRLLNRKPAKPYSICSYEGIFIGSHLTPYLYEFYREKYPGMLFFDSVAIPYLGDKYLISYLFKLDPELIKIKPEWNLYPKFYSPELSLNIQEDISGDVFVIKPRQAALGKGVLIVTGDELDETLKTILNQTFTDSQLQDESYSYWKQDSCDTFLVERYYPSDPIYVEHLGNAFYNPTMRIAFLCKYDKKKIECIFLGSYWRLPLKPINDCGDLNKRTKEASGIPFHFLPVPTSTEQSVINQLSSTLPILYRKMLDRNLPHQVTEY